MTVAESRAGWLRFARAYPVTTFYLLAFAISWFGFLPVFAASRGISFFNDPLWKVLLVFMVAGPALAAWIVSAWTRERGPAASRLLRAFGVAVRWPWWLGALLLPAAMSLAVNLLSRCFGPNNAFAVAPASTKGVMGALLFAVVANPWEEIGWRGFALPRLQEKYGVALAALLVGVMSALWHTPLLLWTQSPMSKYPLGFWAAGTLAHSFLLAVFYNRTNRSLAIVTLLHISLNVFGAAFGVRSWAAYAGVEVVVAAVAFYVFRPAAIAKRTSVA